MLCKKSSLPFDTIQNLPGMTYEKLVCLSHPRLKQLLEDLFSKGITVQQIANIGEDRLKFIYSHSDALQHALRLCSAHDLVGLELPVPLYRKIYNALPSFSTLYSFFATEPNTSNNVITSEDNKESAALT